MIFSCDLVVRAVEGFNFFYDQRKQGKRTLAFPLFFFFREERGQRVKEIVVPSIDLDCEEEMGQNVEVQSVRTEATLGARDYD